MKSRTKLQRILASLLVFSLVLIYILGNIATIPIYAAKKYNYVYVFIGNTKDTTCPFNAVKAKDDKTLIKIIDEQQMIGFKSLYDGTQAIHSEFGTLANYISNAKKSAIIYMPSVKTFGDKYSSIPSTKIEQIAQVNKRSQGFKDLLSVINKDKKVSKIMVSDYGWKQLYNSEAMYNGVVSSLNKTFKDTFSKNKSYTMFENPCTGNTKNFATYLQNTDSKVFAKIVTNDTSTSTGDGTSTSTGDATKGDETGDVAQSSMTIEELFDKLGADIKYKDNFLKYVDYLIGLGYSKAAIAGVLANANQESKLNPLSGGKNGGLFGFTPLSKFANSEYNKNCTHTKGDAGSAMICSDGSCQIEYMLSHLSSDIEDRCSRLDTANKWFSNVKPENLKADLQTSWSNPNFPEKIEVVKTLEEYKQMTDPISAAAVFLICSEVAAGTYEPCNLAIDGGSNRNYHEKHDSSTTWHDYTLFEFNVAKGRLSYAEPIYAFLGGGDLSGGLQGATEMAKEAAKKGYLTEEELSAWTKIINENFIGYKDVLREDLSQSDLSSLSTWETNVRYDELENHGIFNFFRKLFVGIGIFMLLYSGILYCCYWLDRINPFYDLDFLDLATIGKLATAPTEEECNFHVKDFFKDNKDKAKYVNHKAIITICLGLIIFGLMIITGSIYKIVIGIIGLVGDLLNIE